MTKRNYLLLTPGPLSTSESVKRAMLQDWCTWDKDYNGRDSSLTGDARERADRFRLQHEHTFTRAVYIGDR